DGGGGVFATGSAAWVNKLSHTTEFPAIVVPTAVPGVTDILLQVMENVYGLLGTGLGSGREPSVGNWTAIAPGAAGPVSSVNA
ncbi:MAG TPA: hypothetical protein VMF60_09565, partial [Acidimicrobiales bacterium]|nr:hypothetical protein [Acidimicrobiales bacterium]